MAESAWPNRYQEARRFIDNNKAANDRVSTKDAERLKAIITVTGQFNHPGDPMSIVIDRNGLPKDLFETSPLSQKVVDFLTGTPWSVAVGPEMDLRCKGELCGKELRGSHSSGKTAKSYTLQVGTRALLSQCRPCPVTTSQMSKPTALVPEIQRWIQLVQSIQAPGFGSVATVSIA